MEGRTVTISVEQYEQLLAVKTRTLVARDMIMRNKYIGLADLLFVLGFRADAKEIDDQGKEELYKIMEGEKDDE